MNWERATAGSEIDPTVRFGGHVRLGPGGRVIGPAWLGAFPRSWDENSRLTIGEGAMVRPFTTIYLGTVIGDRFQTGQGASIREDNVIGDDVSVGTGACLEFGNRIGNHARIHSGVFMERVTLEEWTFVGPNVTFTDDPHPYRCDRYLDCTSGATVRRFARIGANSTILPGVEIGENALVGAGSVVTKNVPSGAVVAGNPAKVIKRVDELTCPPGFKDKVYDWPPYNEK